MKALIKCLFLLVFLSCSNEKKKNSDQHSTLQGIIESNTKALGGEGQIDNVGAVKIISIKKEAAYLDSIVFIADRNKRMRIDIYDLHSAQKPRVFSESYDGVKGYQWSPEKGQDIASEKGTVALSHTPQYPGHVFQLKDMTSLGHHLKLVGNERIGDAAYFVIELTLSDGFTSYYYIDASNLLISKIRNTRALHVDINTTEQFIEVQQLDYRPVNGVLRPFKIIEVDLVKDSILTETLISHYILNPKLKTKTFADLTGEAN
jgi:hypothetical protein